MENPLSTIAKYLWPEDILLDVEVASKDQLFDEIGRHMEREHGHVARVGGGRPCPAGKKSVPPRWGRELPFPMPGSKSSHGYSLPICASETPIPYDAPDGRLVSDVLVLLVPKRATEEHLLILADATQIFADRQFREQLHSCRHALEVKSLFESHS